MASLIKTINGKDYSFKFGTRFVRAMDKTVEQDVGNGIKYGVGFGMKAALLQNTKDAVTLIDILKVANETESPRVTQSLLENWIDDEVTLEELDKTIDEILSVFNTSTATAGKMKALAAAEK